MAQTQTLRRRRELPVLPAGPPACPAAAKVEGAMPSNAGVVCRVIERDRQKEDGLGVNPAQLAQARVGGMGDVFLTIRSDPSTIERFCFGEGVPVLHDGEHGGGRETYTYCPVKQAEGWAEEHGQHRLSRPVEPETVSAYDPKVRPPEDGAPPVGSSHASADPWGQARRDLDVLAPPAGS